MKTKVFVGIMVTMLLAGTVFIVLPVRGAFVGDIRIGILGPVGIPHWVYGMVPAAEMARDEINDAGGVYLSAGPNGAGYYEVKLFFRDEHAYPTPDPVAARDAVNKFVTIDGCDFILGGFRTEVTSAAIEEAMDLGVTFIINGASTDELISDTVGVDYARYKHLWRVNPINSSMLPVAIMGFLQWLIPMKFLPLYGHLLWPGAPNPQVRVAVLVEDLAWTAGIFVALTNPAIYPLYLGPYANVTYGGKIPETALDLNPWLQDVDDSDARILIHIFSGILGPPLIATWRQRVAAGGSNFVPVGINVYAQSQEYWTSLGGASEYEAFLDFGGTRTPIIPGVTDVWWDNFVAKTGGKWPLYTAWGAYDGVYGLSEALNAIGSIDHDALTTYWENPAYERQALNGKFKFTSGHDVFTIPADSGPFWTQGYIRAFVVQWQESGSGAKQVVSPIDKLYSRRFKIPPWMYPFDTDLNYDGNVNIFDVAIAAAAFGSMPGHPRWDKEADSALPYGIVNIFDVAKVASEFGSFIPIPLP